MNNEIFVKLNYKNIGELKSFVYDRATGGNRNNDKYVMCAGKCDKDGWSIVFKAKTLSEAEELVSRNKRRRENIIKTQMASVEQDVQQLLLRLIMDIPLLYMKVHRILADKSG